MPGVLDSSVLDLPVSAPARAETALVDSVLPKFGAQPEPLETDPRTYLQEVDDQRGAQTIQLLRNLAYLPPPDRPDREEIISAAALEEAWQQWTADYRTNFAKPDGAPDKVMIETETGDAVPEPDRLRRALKACASLEGEVKLGEWPDDDDRLAARILSFRIRLFGLQGGRDGVVSPTEIGLRQHLVRRARWVLNRDGSGGDALEIVNALGDASRLGRATIAQLDGWAVILRTYTADDRYASPLLPGRIAPLAFRPRAERRLSPIRDPNTPGRVRLLNLTDPVEDAQNELAVKIVQVRLWTLGYYPGAIDGSWGPLSDAALDRFIDDDPEDAARPELRIRTPGGYVALIVSPLLQAIAVHADAATERLERAEIDASLRALRDGADRHEAARRGEAPGPNRLAPPGAGDPTADSDAFEAWSSLVAVAERPLEQLRPGDQALALAAPPNGTYVGDDYRQRAWGKPERSEYQGWRGVFAAFGRLLRNAAKGAVSFLRSAIQHLGDFARNLIAAAKAGLGYVRQIVRYIKDAARVAVRIASLATARVRAWIGGTPIVTQAGPAAASTCWQFDFDTVLVVSRACPPSLLESHARTLDWMTRSFSIMTRIGVGLLKLALAAAINWLLFAWRALGLIRELSKDGLFRDLLADEAVV